MDESKTSAEVYALMAATKFPCLKNPLWKEKLEKTICKAQEISQKKNKREHVQRVSAPLKIRGELKKMPLEIRGRIF